MKEGYTIDDFKFTLETCDPRTHGFWKRQCRGPHPSGEHERLPDYVSCVSLTATFASVASQDAICDVMWFGPPNNEKCEQAEAQFMAMLLNICSGRLDRSCCVDSELTAAATVGEAEMEIDALLSNPDRSFDDCLLAQAMADSINTGEALCSGSPQPLQEGDDADGHGWRLDSTGCGGVIGPVPPEDLVGTILLMLAPILVLFGLRLFRDRRALAS